MLSVFIDTTQPSRTAGYEEEARRFIDWVRAAAPIDAANSVMLPGTARERKQKARRRRNSDRRRHWRKILDAAGRLGVPADQIRRTDTRSKRTMENILRIFASLIALLACIAMPAGDAAAQAYPGRPIQIVVPFPAGGSVDVIARLIGQNLSQRVGQSVIVDNRAGATGMIGAGYVAKAAPDGYTILLGTTGPSRWRPRSTRACVRQREGFRTHHRGRGPALLMVVPPSLPVKNLADFIAYAKPGRASSTSSRPAREAPASRGRDAEDDGGPGHDARAVSRRRARRGGPARGAGRAHVPAHAAMQPYVASGQLRALGITSLRRSKAVPEVPTLIEGGLPGFEIITWFGFFAPARTPDAIVERLNSEIARVVTSPDVASRLADLGADFTPNSVKEFAEFIQRDLKSWKAVVEKSGLPLSPAAK